jgi:hypothetical protein
MNSITQSRSSLVLPPICTLENPASFTPDFRLERMMLPFRTARHFDPWQRRPFWVLASTKFWYRRGWVLILRSVDLIIIPSVWHFWILFYITKLELSVSSIPASLICISFWQMKPSTSEPTTTLAFCLQIMKMFLIMTGLLLGPETKRPQR